jgi:hypothetical protein
MEAQILASLDDVAAIWKAMRRICTIAPQLTVHLCRPVIPALRPSTSCHVHSTPQRHRPIVLLLQICTFLVNAGHMDCKAVCLNRTWTAAYYL